MKNSLRIILAAVLILLGVLSYGRNRPRPLPECFPEGQWQEITCQGRELALSQEELKAAFAETTAFPGEAFDELPCASLTLHIHIDGVSYKAEIGENGNIALSRSGDPDEKKTYWRDVDGELFRTLAGH